MQSAHDRILFGLKTRQLRTRLGLSFTELSERSGLSVSYLNEIEKGKKFPRQEKLKALAKALEVPEKELASLEELEGRLGPVGELLRSNFLHDLPLSYFGIEPSKVVEIISTAPKEVGAFVSILLDLSRNYSLREENFYFGALRAYLELHQNYFEEIELAAGHFRLVHGMLPQGDEQVASFLQRLLTDQFGYQIVPEGLSAHPDLQELRAVFLPESRKLLLHEGLTAVQRAFQFGKELGFQYMGLTQRAYTSSLLRVHSFEEALNHFKAGYFAAALLIDRSAFSQDLERLMGHEQWEEGIFTNWFSQYTASPETILQRMSNLLPNQLGIRKIFLWRFSEKGGDIRPDKELNLVRDHLPSRNTLLEHFCRRWPAARLLDTFNDQTDAIVDAARVKMHETGDVFFCLTLLRPAQSSADRRVSLTLGLLIDGAMEKKVRFLHDPSLRDEVVNQTCERCNLADCAQRQAPPSIFHAREKNRRVKEALKNLE